MFRVLMMMAMLAAATSSAWAQAGSWVEMTVIDRSTGRWLDQYHHRGDTWIAGAPGHGYQVRLTNTTGERVLVVFSVDGVNALTGETAAPSQAGYVLEPWQSATISGWRKSLDEVAQFIFTDVGGSYAARTGRPRNVGVIGIAVFQERPRYAHLPSRRPAVIYDEYESMAEDRAPSAPSAPSGSQKQAEIAAVDDMSGRRQSAERQRIGTGHGSREYSRVEETQFRRATSNPIQTTELRYDTVARLTALGVIPRPSYSPAHVRPSAFPNAFVPDPPRRR